MEHVSPVAVVGLSVGILAGFLLVCFACWRMATATTRTEKLFARYGVDDADADRLLRCLAQERRGTAGVMLMAFVLILGSSWGSYDIAFGGLRLRVEASEQRAGQLEMRLRADTAEEVREMTSAERSDLASSLRSAGFGTPETVQRTLDAEPERWDDLPPAAKELYVPPAPVEAEDGE